MASTDTLLGLKDYLREGQRLDVWEDQNDTRSDAQCSLKVIRAHVSISNTNISVWCMLALSNCTNGDILMLTLE
jgi:hypothetical protein